MTSQVLALLERHGISLDDDALDQHLLVSGDVIRHLVDAADISRGESVLEIGPGPGQITEVLLQCGAFVTAIEIDRRFAPLLQELSARFPGHLTVIWGSATEVEWPDQVTKVVMNPPFSITEQLVELLYSSRSIEQVSMVMGQRFFENASTQPGSRGFTRTALMVQAKYDISLVEKIDRAAFCPQAGDRAVIVHLQLAEQPHPILRRLAEYMASDAQLHLRFVLEQVLEVFNHRAKKYRQDFGQYVTMRDFRFKPELLNTRLQELTNYQLSEMVSQLTSQFNSRVRNMKFARGKNIHGRKH
ncbi:MAG: rRNA adenine dimethyltransferase family protein [Patescibacteria group bacterium]